MKQHDFLADIGLDPFEDKQKAGSVLLYGGGVQSTAILWMMIRGEMKPADLVVYAELGNEPDWTQIYTMRMRREAQKADIPFRVVSAFDPSPFHFNSKTKLTGYFGAIMRQETNSMPPLWLKDRETGQSRGLLRRQCTADLKIGQSNKMMREWLLRKGYAYLHGKGGWYPSSVEEYDREVMKKTPAGGTWDHYPIEVVAEDPTKRAPQIRINDNIYVEIMLGMTTDEMDRVDPDRGHKWQKAIYPLVDMGMSRGDVLDWYNKNQITPPGKSACFGCPFRSIESWAYLYQRAPELFELACQFDEWLRSPAIQYHKYLSKVEHEMYLYKGRTPLSDLIPQFENIDTRGLHREHVLVETLMFESCDVDPGNFTCFG